MNDEYFNIDILPDIFINSGLLDNKHSKELTIISFKDSENEIKKLLKLLTVPPYINVSLLESIGKNFNINVITIDRVLSFDNIFKSNGAMYEILDEYRETMLKELITDNSEDVKKMARLLWYQVIADKELYDKLPNKIKLLQTLTSQVILDPRKFDNWWKECNENLVPKNFLKHIGLKLKPILKTCYNYGKKLDDSRLASFIECNDDIK